MIKPRVLVVDDEAANRGLIRRVLEALGCQIREAADGELALEVVAIQVPDLIQLDLEMPWRDGYQNARDRRHRVLPPTEEQF